MTRCAALYCGEKGYDIRVNAVAPGYILTPMAEEDARQNGQTIEEYCSEFAAHHPIGRMGTPLEIAEAYLYLASDASSFVTGYHSRIRWRLYDKVSKTKKRQCDKKSSGINM